MECSVVARRCSSRANRQGSLDVEERSQVVPVEALVAQLSIEGHICGEPPETAAETDRRVAEPSRTTVYGTTRNEVTPC